MKNWATLPLRLGLGVMFIAHGLQKALGAFGGPGIEGFSKMLSARAFMVFTRMLVAALKSLTQNGIKPQVNNWICCGCSFVITGSCGKSKLEAWYCLLNDTFSKNNAEKRFINESGPGTEYR